MKKTLIIALILVLSIGILLAGCTPEAQENFRQAIQSMTRELSVGDTYSWSPSFYRKDSEGNNVLVAYTASEVIYSSSDSSIASVSESGLVTAIAVGTINITASYEDETGTLSDMIFVVVYSPQYTISVGDSITWDACAAMDTNGEIDFTTGSFSTSQNGKGSVNLSVSENGVVTITGAATGFATVTARYNNGTTNPSASVVVKVS